MKLLIIFSLIILLIIFLNNRKNEYFLDEKIKAKLIKGISLNMGEIENLDSLEIKSVPNSEKLLIENIIKNYTLENLIFNRNCSTKMPQKSCQISISHNEYQTR